MTDSNPLQSRLDSLGWTYNKLAERVAEADPEGRTAQALYTAVRNVVKTPANAKLSTLQRVVEAMGGEVLIKWKPTEGEETKL